ncbi:MAG: hypothetical protein IJ037_08160 [Clostridia bacterium]|nr:hypothetical protein [Clostridia bacterium]
MHKPDLSKLPPEFVTQYRRNIVLRSVFSGILMLAAVVSCFVIDISGVRYPIGAVIFILLAGYLLSCLLFRLDLLLFRRSWTGEILSITFRHEWNYFGTLIIRTASLGNSLRDHRLTGYLKIDRGGKKPYLFALRDSYTAPRRKKVTYRNDEFTGSGHTVCNRFQVEAPYKLNDRLVYLRGLKYPMRIGVDTDGTDAKLVCPYCGEINEAERGKCWHCGRILIK